MNRDAIEAGQLVQLRSMFETIRAENRFYAPRIKDAGLPESLVEFFAKMPFTTKQELVDDQRAHPPFGTNLSFPVERYTRFSQTSGTTGSSIRWLDTPESWAWMVENWALVFRTSGVGPGDRIFFAFSFGPFLGFWTAFEAGKELGCLCLPGGGMSSAARLRTIVDNGVTVLCCTPTYAIRLGEVALEEGIDWAASKVRAIVVAGEPGAGIPATRARIERLWPGARLWDHHGMTETGPVTFECPVRTGTLHVIESAFISEVIDPETGQAVGPGERGELVLTNLGRIGSPLIRYRTGDLVQRADEAVCACGRHDLALPGGILGRTDDMVVVRGVNLHPSAVEQVVREFEQIAEFRVEVAMSQTMAEITIQIEPIPLCLEAEGLAQRVESALRAAFNLRVPVTSVPCGTLPRFEAKAKRWVRKEVA